MTQLIFIVLFAAGAVVLVLQYLTQLRQTQAFKKRVERYVFHYQASDDTSFAKRTSTTLLMDTLREMYQSKTGKSYVQMVAIGTVIGGTLLWIYNAPIMLFLLVVVVLPAPLMWLAYRVWQAKELEAFIEDLPNNIDIFSRVIRSGIPVEKALQSLAKESDGLLRRELTKVYEQTMMGVPLTAALEESSHRVNSVEYQFFTIVLALNQDAGGSLSDTLSNLTANMRRRQQVGRKLLALTAEGRASANIVLLIPAFLIGIQLYLSPDQVYFLVEDPTGKNILMYALIFMTIGFLWIKRLSRI